MTATAARANRAATTRNLLACLRTATKHTWLYKGRLQMDGRAMLNVHWIHQCDLPFGRCCDCFGFFIAALVKDVLVRPKPSLSSKEGTAPLAEQIAYAWLGKSQCMHKHELMHKWHLRTAHAYHAPATEVLWTAAYLLESERPTFDTTKRAALPGCSLECL
jgi:hypothetical protein